MMLHCNVMPTSCKGKREADNNGQYQQVASSGINTNHQVASLTTSK